MAVAPVRTASAAAAGRLGPRLIVAAAVAVAGGALYCTRASLDVYPTPRGPARVAMLPSWPELAGLGMLAALVIALLVWWLAERKRDPGRRAPVGEMRRRWIDPAIADVLLPLLTLALLAVPYVPWVADALPMLRIFAGPARFLLWAVVTGQVVVMIARAPRYRAHAAIPWSLGAASAAVFLASVVAFGVGAWRLAGSAIYPGGDEPHYLIITQSLLRDRDLKIENNHQREDYAEYFGSVLEPHYRTRGVDKQIYSIHPIGLPVLAVPAYAIGGYRGVVLMLVLVAACAVTLMWRWTAAATGSFEAATLAWAAVSLGAPYFFNAFAVYPEIPAALCVMAALAENDVGGNFTSRVNYPRRRFLRGLALAALPWLSTKYAPMALAIAAVLTWRLRRRTFDVALVLAPFVLSTIAWLWFFYWIWGSPLPSAPYGPDPQTHPATLIAGAPGLLIDQEYGVFVYAPALMVAIVGWVDMWRAGGAARRLALETIAVFAALLATVGAFELWWGGSGIAGRPLVSGLPLLGPAIGWAYRSAAAAPARRAAHLLLVLCGIAMTGALLFAQGGLLLAEGRDGASELLRWLSPGWPLASIAPSFIVSHGAGAFARALPWLAAVFVFAAICRRMPIRDAGRASLTVTLIAMSIVIALGVALPALSHDRMAIDPPETRGRIDLLDDYDALARPYAITYSPLRRIDVHQVPPLFEMTAVPGSRRYPQPIPVLLNARFSLPAGRYDVELRPGAGRALTGELGLQVGRIGRPRIEWPVNGAPGESWTHGFTLDVDASFVGFVASDSLKPLVAELRLTPAALVDKGARVLVPTVLAASTYGSTVVYFHDDHVFTEDTGFWVAGRTTMSATVVTAEPQVPLQLRMHGGPSPSTVFIETPVWRREVPLTSGESVDVTVPPAARGAIIPLRMTTYNAFIPARESPGSGDERLLGCWVEVK